MYDVIIVGAGPAGLTAGIYASRANMKTLILAKNLGGQAAERHYVENYPGFRSVGGLELMQKLEEQTKAFGAKIIYEGVERIEEKDRVYTISTNRTKYKAKSVILAYGKTPRMLGVPGEEKFQGRGMSYCSICDGPVFRNKTVAVVGGGNAALDAVLYMSEIAEKVYLVHRRDEFRGFEALVDEIKKKKNVELVLNSVVIKVSGDKFVKSITVENNQKKRTRLDVAGVFVEIGSEVDTDLIKDMVKLEDNHVGITNRCETFYPNSDKIHPGLFAAGDLASTPYKQIVISASEGAKAALQAYNYIHSIKGMPSADWGTKKKNLL